MKSAVITGATGMIGCALVQECVQRGIKVLAIVRPKSRNRSRLPRSPLVTVVEAEISALSEVDIGVCGNRWDVFYHLAWNTIEAADRQDVGLQLANVQYMLDAVRLAKRLGCSRFVGAGSQAEYGTFRSGKLAPDTPTNPADAYGLAKLTAGKAGAMLGMQLGLQVLWLRVFSVFGPYDRATSMIQSTISNLQYGQKPLFTAGTQTWDYLYVNDAAVAFYLLGSESPKGAVYCLGSGASRPLVEYIEMVREVFSPGAALGIGAITSSGDPVNIEPVIDDLVNDVGFSPKVDFVSGLHLIQAFMNKSKDGLNTMEGI